MFTLTILYGLVIALLAMLDVPALGIVAAIGGVLLGCGWGFSGRFTRRT
ncbi:hypothetical protein [Actinomadura mexicana]|uniref:Uncharacterized protein n=1 Tax=Actinomadura mexicana TaxID=134959 RepID=A0A238XAA5_9ACTN|nr:hypothetical protein [Actinomadura mexicana]SNR55453.1 hypothetical protein SAMN06265355_10499 [Actinomadura mexicana]